MKQHFTKSIVFTGICLVTSLFIFHFLETAREGATWIYTVFPLCGLFLNLFWPCSRTIKLLALLILTFTVHLHGAFELNAHVRDIAAVERSMGENGSDVGLNREVLQHTIVTADHAMSDVWLSLTIGIAFAIIPHNAVALAKKRWLTRLPPSIVE